jgi:hypothetical protein
MSDIYRLENMFDDPYEKEFVFGYIDGYSELLKMEPGEGDEE